MTRCVSDCATGSMITRVSFPHRPSLASTCNPSLNRCISSLELISTRPAILMLRGGTPIVRSRQTHERAGPHSSDAGPETCRWPAYAAPSARSRPRGQGMQRTPGSGPGWSRARRADRTRTLRAVRREPRISADEGGGMDNVLAVNFAEDSKAYEALSSLKELDGQGQLDLAAAAVVVRGEDGHIDV